MLIVLTRAERRAALSKLFSGTQGAAGDNAPDRLTGSPTQFWAGTAARALNNWGWSPKKVNEAYTASRTVPQGTQETASASSEPKGFGGSGQSGLPAGQLGAHMTAGNYVAPAAPQPPEPPST